MLSLYPGPVPELTVGVARLLEPGSEGVYGPTGCLRTCPRRVAKYEACILCEPGNDILKVREANKSEHLLVLVYVLSLWVGAGGPDFFILFFYFLNLY